MADAECSSSFAQLHEKEKEQQPENGGGGLAPSNAVPVVGVPTYPNCIKWSDDNLLAVGAGHLVTILNPASMAGPRGFIPVVTSLPFNIGTVQSEDLQAPSLFQFCLARQPRPGVRAIDWSPPGLAQNGGCLLAMCTTDNRVKVYRAPYCDLQAEWIEIIDLSELVYNYALNNGFREAEVASARLAKEDEGISPPLKWGFGMKRKLPDDEEPQHRKVKKTRDHMADKSSGPMDVVVASAPLEGVQGVEQDGVLSNATDMLTPSLEIGSRVEVYEEDDGLQYWISGSIADIAKEEALVKLDQFQYGAMQEWVPLPNQSSLNGMRPRIRPLVVMDTLDGDIRREHVHSGLLAVGESVETLVNGKWQEGTVSELHGAGVSVKFSSHSSILVIDSGKVRLPPFWDGKQWIWRNNSSGSSVNRPQSKLDAPVSTALNCRGECTSFTLDFEQGNSSSTGTSGSEQDSPNELVDTEEECLSKIDKTREPAHEIALPVSHSGVSSPNSDSHRTEICSTRPSRSRRLPSKYRDEDSIVSWNTKDKGAMVLYQNDEQNKFQHLEGHNVLEEGDVGDLEKEKLGTCVKKTGKGRRTKTTKGPSIPRADRGSKCGETVKLKSQRKNSKDGYISAPEYAARSEMLAPLAVAWSSKYQKHYVDDGSKQEETQKFVLLAAGMKSGAVSLWRMACPQSYTISDVHRPVAASFLGFLNAHNSWITSLSWASCSDFDLTKLNPLAFSEGVRPTAKTLLLATGGADGSVKLWAGCSSELSGRSFANDSVPFTCLSQVVQVDSIQVTSLALIVPPQPGDRVLLAVGKGSGSIGIWELSSTGEFGQASSQLAAHQQLVTGLSWTYDGLCLYSCGQDSLKSWDFSHSQMLSKSFPDGTIVFPTQAAPDLCSLEALESYSGITLSHNSLALATVRGVASDLLDQMYQARSQKGIVQLFWLGSERVDLKQDYFAALACVAPSPKAFSEHEKVCWELNILAALERLQDPGQTLVLWDVIAALISLKEKIGIEGVVSMLSNWLSAQRPGAVGWVNSLEWSAGSFENAVREASCRKLQILNIMYRRLFLSDFKAEVLSSQSTEEFSGSEDINIGVTSWNARMHLVELNLRQRLVHLSLQNAACKAQDIKNSQRASNSLGIQLQVKWVLDNPKSQSAQLVKVATELAKNKCNLILTNSGVSNLLEACTYCDSAVPLESPESGSCVGSHNMVGAARHQLHRCSVSMQICPPSFSWHCGCCARSAFQQASSLFFSLSSGAQISEMSLPLVDDGAEFPSCPFCGILMHRVLPNFLLVPTLV